MDSVRSLEKPLIVLEGYLRAAKIIIERIRIGNNLVGVRLFCKNNEKKKAGAERRGPTGFSRVEQTFPFTPNFRP